MNDLVDFYTAALPRGPHSESRLLEEIAFLETRTLEFEANSAYERSLVRTYQALLQTRRQQLADLRRSD